MVASYHGSQEVIKLLLEVNSAIDDADEVCNWSCVCIVLEVNNTEKFAGRHDSNYFCMPK